ncbi:MAG: DUF2164 domain-containing protein [Pelosinus sp.]|nr:DUF2164 domain-containing protein [Pelosinus sp.]
MSKIKISKEVKAEFIKEIQSYFLKQQGEEIGTLAAGFLADFIIEKLGPFFYNQGIKDACVFMTEKVEDMYGLEKKER